MLCEEDNGVKLGEARYCMSFLLHPSENRGVEGIIAGIINTLRCVSSGLRREVDDNLGCPETSVRSYHDSLRNNPEEREYPSGFQRGHVSWTSLSLLTLPCDDWFSKFSAIRTIGVTELSRCLRNKILKNVWVCEACLR